MKNQLFLFGIFGAATIGIGLSVEGASNPKAATVEPDVVQEILKSEQSSSNDSINRRDELNPEAHATPVADVIWWQSGYVQSGKQWVKSEDSRALGPAKSVLDEYQAQRQKLSKLPHGQYKLANWCRKNELLDQEKVHLLRVLAERDPSVNFESIYERLGCKQVGNVWVSPREYRDAVKFGNEIERSQRLWDEKLQTLIKQLQGTSKQVAMAETDLAQINDPSAVPTVVTAFCTSTMELAERGVKILGQISAFQASRALAGQAVFSPWKSIRNKAIDSVKQRKLTEYVPDLLLLLSNPLRTASKLETSKAFSSGKTMAIDHEINWDYVWIDERQDTIHVGIRRLFPISSPNSFVEVLSYRHPVIQGLYDRNTGQLLSASDRSTVLNELREQAEYLDFAADRANDFREAVNERVCIVLSGCTNEPMSSKPKVWWDWWTQYSSVSPTDQKNVVVVDERKNQPNIPSLQFTSIRFSCLVAGTSILTERGNESIEKIKPGDRVLSKDIETGELSYKPVLATTVREPTSVKSFHVGDEEIVASPGHHFWVSGDGWMKVRDLRSQQPLHTATGMNRINSVEDEGRIEKVYNLVVADFHTYFVGKSMVLSHDVTTPSLTNVKVPGLTPK